MSSDGQQGPAAYAPFVVRPHEQAIICGQAVNLWALIYSAKAPELQPFEPFVSKDLDVLGNEESYANLRSLGIWSSCVLFKPKPGQPPLEVVGALRAMRPDGTEINVEIRRTVYGLKPAELSRIADVEFNGEGYLIMEPHACLKGKLANLADIPQDRRQDGRHVQILTSCLRCYIEEIHDLAITGTIPAEHVQTLIRETSAVVRSTNALKAATALNLNFGNVISKEILASPNEQIRGTALRARASIEASLKNKQSQGQRLGL